MKKTFFILLFYSLQNIMAQSVDSILNISEKLFNDAKGFYKKKEYENSILCIDRAVLLRPKESDYLHLKALIFSDLKIPDSTIYYADLLLTDSPYNLKSLSGLYAKAYYQKGGILSHKEEFIEAIKNYTYAIQYDSTVAVAYFDRGGVKMTLNDYRGAIYDFKKAFDFWNSWGEFNEGFDFRKIMMGECYYAISICNYKIENFDEAITAVEEALKYEKEKSKYYTWYGLLLIGFERKEEGCINFSKGGELGDESAYGLIKKYCQ